MDAININKTLSLNEADSLALAFKIILILLTILLNGLIIFIIIFLIKIKTFSNYLFLSATLADFFIGLISQPLMTIYSLYNYWPFNEASCISWMIVDYSCFSVSLFSILFISIQRYKQLTQRTINEDLNKWRCLLIGLIWVFSFLFWSLMVIPIVNEPNSMYHECDYIYTTSTYVILTDLFAMVLPILFIIIMNCFIFKNIRTKKLNSSINAKKISRRAYITFLTSTSDCILNLNGTNNNFSYQSIKKLSQASFTRLKINKDRKALLCLFMISASIIVTYSLFLILWPLKSFCDGCVSESLFEISNWLIYSSSVINAILLLIFHKAFQKKFVYIIFYMFRGGFRKKNPCVSV